MKKTTRLVFSAPTPLAMICALCPLAFAASGPTAQNMSVNVAGNFDNPILLQGSGSGNGPLTFKVVSVPFFGTLSGAAPNLIYRPAINYLGPDSFEFVVSDGKRTSAPAKVSLSVKQGILIRDASVSELNSGSHFVSLAYDLTLPLLDSSYSFTFSTSDGTATAGLDYRAARDVFVTQKTTRLEVEVIGDTSFELNETFLVQLANPSVNVVIARGTGRCTILNDDPFSGNVVCCATIGAAALAPEDSVARVGEPITLSLDWTHPTGWRQLDSVDLLLSDGEGTVLLLRWHEAENAFSVLNAAADEFLHLGQASSSARLENPVAALLLSDSTGGGPPGQTVTIDFTLDFKPPAAGRTFSVEAFATDDEGHEQGFESAGTITVLPR